ncbi:MAG TPA: hypothetical protein VJY64_03120 [Candidatus Onthovivens sp.]|nr:hypothetical protein [Candidatus Onthovivens sp.]
MNIGFYLIAAFFFGLLVLGLKFLFETLQYNKTGSENYNFLRFMPYELNSFKRYNKNTFFPMIIQLIGSLSLVLASVLFVIYFKDNFGAYVIGVFSILSILSFNFLSFVKLSNYKLHLIFDACLISFNLLTILASLYFLNNRDFNFIGNNNQVLIIINVIIISILFIFQIVLMVNPTYKTWAKMVNLGAHTFNRPKVCYLAILEWGSLLVFILNFIPLIITVFGHIPF